METEMVGGYEFEKGTLDSVFDEDDDDAIRSQVGAVLRKALGLLGVLGCVVLHLDDGPVAYAVEVFFRKTYGEYYEGYRRDYRLVVYNIEADERPCEMVAYCAP